MLAAQFIEVVVRTSANQVGLESAIGRSPTVGGKEFPSSSEDAGRTRWLVSLARFVAPVSEQAGTLVALRQRAGSLLLATMFATIEW